jgi:hypothetical protein
VRVVGICGHARHGKDSLALAMLRVCPGAERFAFSDAISAYARVTGQMSERDPKVLQKVGWEMRQRMPDAWKVALYWAVMDRAPRLAVVTGVRFPDEAALVRRMDGRIVRVRRLNADGTEYVDPERDRNHPVEAAIEGLGFDAEVVVREGELGRLDDHAAAVLDRWM